MKHKPISAVGFKALRTWVMATKDCVDDPTMPKPDDSLLFVGLPQGSVAAITPEFGLRVRAKKTAEYPDGLRSPRLFDPEGIAVIRLLLAGGGTIFLNKKEVETAKRLDYLLLKMPASISSEDWISDTDIPKKKVTALRLIANTKIGEQTQASCNHYSYKRSDIPEFKPNIKDVRDAGYLARTPKAGREDAIKLAKAMVETNQDSLGFPLQPSELESLLREAFALLDRRPLKK